MKKLLLLILFIAQFAFAQTSKKVGDFNKVTTFDRIEVKLIASNENKVILDGDNAEEVELVNKNGELKIRMPLTKLLSGDAIFVTVYFIDLEAVEANEGSKISCETILESNIFDVIAKEGSQIDIKVNTEKLNCRLANGSILKISGAAENQELVLNSGANFEGQNLKTNQTTITVNAGGEASIFATNIVDAKVRAGGTILIYGKPKQINQKTIAGGTIKEVK